MSPRVQRAAWLGLGFALGAGFAGALYLWMVGRILVIGPSSALPEAQVDRLDTLAREALTTEDIPIAALLLYRGEIIGEGRNRIEADHDVGAHAEIEAINDALRRRGDAGFTGMDRSQLEIVSTFEPCLMCQGAMVTYGVQRATFLRGKPLGHLLQHERARLRLLFDRVQREPVSLQEELFQLHPKYPGRRR